ncbi:DUF1746-domain-containing protein [Wilcoxina mikolae CBS 423.85]|nr:DUF1746-domain-containing protein [Wilcoxina mikolae CBS 423.85]
MSDVGDPSSSSSSPYKSYLTQKHQEFLTHMLRNIDIITYLHLTYLYFLELTSTAFLFLTPKIITFPLPPHQRSPIIALLGTTAFCVLEHLWEANPSAGELTHGYQHGGLIVDFIGQQGPISKWRLLYVDVAVLLLQLMMLSLVVSQQELTPPPPPGEDTTHAARTSQDLEAEERGEVGLDDDDDDGGEGENGDVEGRVFAVTAGEFEVAKMDVVGVVRRQWGQGATVGGGEAPAARIERRGGRWRFTISGQTRGWN